MPSYIIPEALHRQVVEALTNLADCYCDAREDMSRAERDHHRKVLIRARAAVTALQAIEPSQLTPVEDQQEGQKQDHPKCVLEGVRSDTDGVNTADGGQG